MQSSRSSFPCVMWYLLYLLIFCSSFFIVLMVSFFFIAFFGTLGKTLKSLFSTAKLKISFIVDSNWNDIDAKLVVTEIMLIGLISRCHYHLLLETFQFLFLFTILRHEILLGAKVVFHYFHQYV